MKTVYKYYLKDESTVIALPVGSKVVCVGVQSERVTIWVEQDTEKRRLDFSFYIVPTGSDIPFGTAHVGTCFIGPYVWHIYQTI